MQPAYLERWYRGVRVSLIKKDLRLLIRQQQDVTARCLLPSAHLLADGMHGHAVFSHRLSRISARRALTKGSHAFAGRLPCPPVPWRREPGDLVLGLTTHLHVLAVAVCSQIAHAIHRCVRCTNQRARSHVCVCRCVYVRVCMCVCVYVCMRRTEMRARRTTAHDPRSACSAMQRPSLGGGEGWSRPISNIQHLAVHGLVWSGLSSGPPRLAGPVYSLRGRSKDGDHACHPIERLRRASALRWRFREGSSRRPMVLDGGVPSSSSSTPWPAR